MRVLIDPDTGELVEVVDEAVLDLTPYDYRQAKAAAMRQSREKRDAIKAYKEAVREKGEAQRAYRSIKAREILKAKAEHGSTVAADVAFTNEELCAAKERAVIAEGMVIAEYEVIRLSGDDKRSIEQLTAWSRQADPDTFAEHGA